jgi:hypothetical protein
MPRYLVISVLEVEAKTPTKAETIIRAFLDKEVSTVIKDYSIYDIVSMYKHGIFIPSDYNPAIH